MVSVRQRYRGGIYIYVGDKGISKIKSPLDNLPMKRGEDDRIW